MSATVTLGDQDLSVCEFNVGEVYGAGNEAYMSGTAKINMNCVDGLSEIYGGARMADINGDVELNINSGYFGRVFGGNNVSGCIRGSITVNIQENGCLPIIIDELYLGGNNAPYSVFGYDASDNCIESGTNIYAHPHLNIISATKIGKVYGGGLGKDAIIYGNPYININMEQGKLDGKYVYVEGKSNERYRGQTFSAGKIDLGHLGTIYGGGNAAKVVGDTHIYIGTGTDEAGNALKQTDDATHTRHDAQISGNVYGGGNQAEVTGKTNVVIGHE